MNKSLNTLIAIFCFSNLFSQIQRQEIAVVGINNLTNTPITVSVFEPLGGFTNDLFETYSNSHLIGSNFFEVKLSHAVLFQIKIEGNIYKLICEPGDTVSFNVSDSKNILISGDNKKGHVYLNTKYFNRKLLAYDKLRNIFGEKDDANLDTLVLKINKMYAEELSWLDSLVFQKEVTPIFKHLMSLNFKTSLYYELINLVLISYDNGSITDKVYLDFFLRFLNAEINLVSKEILAGAFWGFFERYAKLVEQVKGNPIVKHDYFPKENFYLEWLPQEHKPLIYWAVIKFEFEALPYKYDYCNIYERYKQDFPESPFSKLGENVFCTNKERPKYDILSCDNESIFQCINGSFSGSKVLIDIWATWCGPCKAEFKYYDSLMYSFASEQGVKLLFLSIDDAADADKWRKEVEASGLKGHHLLADATMLASLKEVIFDDGVVSIPRYILINEKGYFVSTDFVRPSDPDFKKKLIKAFSKP